MEVVWASSSVPCECWWARWTQIRLVHRRGRKTAETTFAAAWKWCMAAFRLSSSSPASVPSCSESWNDRCVLASNLWTTNWRGSCCVNRVNAWRRLSRDLLKSSRLCWCSKRMQSRFARLFNDLDWYVRLAGREASASLWSAIAWSKSSLLPRCSKQEESWQARLFNDLDRSVWPTRHKASASLWSVIASFKSLSLPWCSKREESWQARLSNDLD